MFRSGLAPVILLGAVACGSGGSDDAGPAAAGASGSTGTGGAESGGTGNAGSGGIAGTTSAGTGGTAGSGSSGCSAFVQAYCAKELDCSPIAFHAEWYGTMQNCLDRSMPFCELELAAPGTSMTSDTIAACTAATSKQSCADFLTAAPSECLVPGALANGAGCEFSSQCQSTLCDVGTNACGTCQPRLGVGGKCLSRGDLRFMVCQKGLVCTSVGCANPVPQGGSCNRLTDGQCAPPLVCVQSICSPAIAIGDKCYDSGQCAGDAFCKNLNTGGLLIGSVCAALQYQPAGAPCDAISNWCSGGPTCKDENGMFASTGTCVAAVQDGQPCTDSSECVIPSKCSNGACEARPPASSCP